MSSEEEIKGEAELQEILDDADVLLEKIIDRLENQSTIIEVATKVRIIRLFIMQIATGGNKVHFQKEYAKIVKKIKAMNVAPDEKGDVDAVQTIKPGSQITKKRKTPGIVVKMPPLKRDKK